MGQCDGVSTPAHAQLFYLACAAHLSLQGAQMG